MLLLIRGLDPPRGGMSRAHENAERYGDMLELRAVFENGESGPDDGTENRASSLLGAYLSLIHI